MNLMKWPASSFLWHHSSGKLRLERRDDKENGGANLIESSILEQWAPCLTLAQEGLAVKVTEFEAAAKPRPLGRVAGRRHSVVARMTVAFRFGRGVVYVVRSWRWVNGLRPEGCRSGYGVDRLE
jgi:hypothetical protein